MKKALAAIIGLLFIFSSAFAECVFLPDALTRIEASTFASNSSLTRILFGENLIFIGKNAFAGCSSLVDICAYNKKEVIVETGAFHDVPIGFTIQTFLGKMTAEDIEKEKKLPARPRYRALLVGETYNGIEELQLKGCDKDADSMHQVLEALTLTEYKSTSIYKLIDASRSQIITEINKLAQDSVDTDVTFFYFSGHGEAGGILVGYDAERYDEENEWDEWLYPARLRNELHKIKGKKIVVVDACYSGGLIGRSKNDNLSQEFAKGFLFAFTDDISPRSGELADNNGEFNVLVSCSVREDANILETETGVALSLFTFFFQKTIGYDRLLWKMTNDLPGDRNGDFLLTLEEIYEYIQDETTKFIKEWNDLHNDENPINQTVQVWPDNSSFVVFGHRPKE